MKGSFNSRRSRCGIQHSNRSETNFNENKVLDHFIPKNLYCINWHKKITILFRIIKYNVNKLHMYDNNTLQLKKKTIIIKHKIIGK